MSSFTRENFPKYVKDYFLLRDNFQSNREKVISYAFTVQPSAGPVVFATERVSAGSA